MAKEVYFERARSWALDQRLLNARSMRVAWIVASCAIAIALFEAIALAMLAPLKTVEPVTLLVDRQTGYVQALSPTQPQRISADAALTQSYLAQYVVAREGYDRALVAADYRKVALLSTGVARADYLATMTSANPASPLRRYQPGTVVDAEIKSVVALAKNTALVRFDSRQTDVNGRSDAAQSWISLIRYRYVDAPMAIEDRLVNPLGFQVWSYRREPEAAPTYEPKPSIGAVAVPATTYRIEEALPQTAVPPARRLRNAPTSGAVVAEPASRVRAVPINQIPLGSPLAREPQ